MDSHNSSIGNTNKYTCLDQRTHPNGYPSLDIHACANLHHYSGAKPDSPPDRYPLGHLDPEPDIDRYKHPDSHPGCSGYLYFRPNLDATPDRHSLARSNAHQYQIKNA